MAEQRIVARVAFDPKLRTYVFLQAVLVGTLSIVGLLTLPLFLWLAWWWSGRHFQSLSCTLTERRLLTGKGVLFRRERAIPLDKIQDVSLIRGPLLNALGLVKLRVETAGSGSHGEGAAADLTGVAGAEAFQELVLAQRDREAERHGPAAPASDRQEPAGIGGTLAEMLEVLKRIEAKLPAG